MAKTYDFDDFCQITEMLRKKEGGCPWDLSQTHQSLKPYMLSETAEAVAAIDLYEQTKDASNLCEELGDMLFQVVIQSQIAAEEGLFTINDVVQSISEKMIRRHPHVFGEESYELEGDQADREGRYGRRSEKSSGKSSLSGNTADHRTFTEIP